MGFVTVEAGGAEQRKRMTQRLEYLTLAVVAILSAITVYFHEPWSDEANSWLLARDATLWELWTRLMHYEGTPGLWQTLLHVLQRVGLPYTWMNAVSGALGVAGAWVLVRKAPFPLALRMAMPFTFYLFYQYSIVARSYCLLPVLLFSCGWLYPRAEQKVGVLTVLLCLMASVSVHGMIISGAIWVSMHGDLAHRWEKIEPNIRKKLWPGKMAGWALAYGVVTGLLAWSAWPARDVMFAKTRDYSFEHLVGTSSDTLANAFTGEWISSLGVVLVSLPFLWKGRGLLMFLTAGTGLFAFNAYVYANVWHEGMPFLAWLFAMWIAAEALQPKWMAGAAWLGMAGVIGMQGYWAAATTGYDWANPYSGSRAAARYIRENRIVEAGLYGQGFAAEAVQPYFDQNIYANFRSGEKTCYYDWSEAFRNFGDLDEVAEVKPEYVAIGFKDEEEKILNGRDVRKMGYRLERHFEGNLYWHDDVLEPDGVDLYRRVH
jgi:hypothetical protein